MNKETNACHQPLRSFRGTTAKGRNSWITLWLVVGAWFLAAILQPKIQSMVWKLSGSLKLRKFKQTFCGRKLMATGFGTEEMFCWWYYESRSNSHVRSVLWDVKTIKEDDSKQMAWPADFVYHVPWQRVTPHCCVHSPATQAVQCSKLHYNNFRQFTCLQSGDIRCCIDTVRPPEDEQRTAQNM